MNYPATEFWIDEVICNMAPHNICNSKTMEELDIERLVNGQVLVHLHDYMATRNYY